MGVKSRFIKIPEDVFRINLKLKSLTEPRSTEWDFKISAEKVQELMEKLDTERRRDVLWQEAFHHPCRMAYARRSWRDWTEGRDDRVDAARDLLVNVLKYHPFLVKPNNHELGEIFGSQA